MNTIAPGEPYEVLQFTYGTHTIAQAGGTLFWTARDTNGWPRLHRWDGKTATVVGGHAVDPYSLTPIGDGRAMFYAWDDRLENGSFEAIWVTDGTAAGTRRVSEPGAGSQLLTRTRNGVIYAGSTAEYGREPHRSDGTPEGTGPLLDINRMRMGSAPEQAARVGDRVVFRTFERGRLWTTDGTAAGTTPVPLDTVPYGIAADRTAAYFAGYDGALYRTNGTEASKVLDAGIDGWTFNGLGRVGDAFVFTASTNQGSPAVWRTDGARRARGP